MNPIEKSDSTAFMTSPIGNLPINSEGLRRAVDEIARCHFEIEQRDKYIKRLEEETYRYAHESHCP